MDLHFADQELSGFLVVNYAICWRLCKAGPRRHDKLLNAILAQFFYSAHITWAHSGQICSLNSCQLLRSYISSKSTLVRWRPLLLKQLPHLLLILKRKKVLHLIKRLWKVKGLCQILKKENLNHILRRTGLPGGPESNHLKEKRWTSPQFPGQKLILWLLRQVWA